VIFEVLSKSTERRDRGWKFKQYRKIPSLAEYVLVAQDRPYIERFARPPGGKFELDELEGFDAVLRLSTGNIELPLRDIYLDILSAEGDDLPPEAADVESP